MKDGHFIGENLADMFLTNLFCESILWSKLELNISSPIN